MIIEKDGMREDVQFTCPQCGSHEFGSGFDSFSPPSANCQYCHGRGRIGRGACSCTYDTERGAKMSGCCHGPGGCRFTWDRKDDAKYFKGLGTFRPIAGTGISR